jgi:hypothetical protein
LLGFFVARRKQQPEVSMHKEVLLYRLRARLEWVEKLLADVAHVQPSSARYLYAAGQTMELRSEALFLAGLIADLESEAG